MWEKNASPNYWIFSNQGIGEKGHTIWDMSWILKNRRYSFREKESNIKWLKPNDVVFMRIYGKAFIGRFIIGGPWEKAEEEHQGDNVNVGTFPMRDVEIWSRPLPQFLVINDISNGNHRSRITSITGDDAVRIQTAQRVYARLGFGGEDKNILILEKGIEEALKPNLHKLGLTLAGEKIRQQFNMGIGTGRSDLICLDENDNLVVLELKRGVTSDETIAQVLRYMGWLQENVAVEGQKVGGVSLPVTLTNISG